LDEICPISTKLASSQFWPKFIRIRAS